jgi:hypothetical protein
MIEALIALPALLALLLGVSLVREIYVAKQLALADARRCALLHAASGCGPRVPEGCNDVLLAGPQLADDGSAFAILTATNAVSARDALHLLDGMPDFAAALNGLFGTTTGAHAVRDVHLPGPSREARPVTGGMVLACNERETNVLGAVKRAACEAAGFDEIDVLDLCGGG